jgi:putative ABC transport system permease protein
MQQFWESLRQGLLQMASHKLRSSLTLLGIFIGVAAIIGSSTLLDAVHRMVIRNFERMGQLNIMAVQASRGRMTAGRWVDFQQMYPLTMEDAAAIRRTFPTVQKVAVLAWQRDTVRAGDASVDGVGVSGVSEGYDKMRNLNVAEGRFLNQGDIDRWARSAVISARLRDDLFQDGKAVGREIWIGRQRFTVVGCLKPQGGNTREERAQVYIPYTDSQYRLYGEDQNGLVLYLQTENAEQAQDMLHHLPGFLAKIHAGSEQKHFDTWSVGEWQAESLRDVEVQGKILYVVAVLCLLTGGIGIMNIMLVSVTERTREIGLRKALGAKNRHILTQFLVEAFALSMVGGISGIAGGWGVGRLLLTFAKKAMEDGGGELTIVLGPGTIFIAVGTASAVAFIFGIFPALKASRLNPIVALRYE